MYSSKHPDWHEAEHFIVGYGSLMSIDSRHRYNQNTHQAASIQVEGFTREWITRSFDEQQTYLGATKMVGSMINAHCIPVSLNPELQKREQDYRFIPVERSCIEPTENQSERLLQHLLRDNVTIWICESLLQHTPSIQYPIAQTYIDTCLSGCLLHGGLAEAKQFIQTTSGWAHIVNDRGQPMYPRAATIPAPTLAIIDNELMPLIGS